MRLRKSARQRTRRASLLRWIPQATMRICCNQPLGTCSGPEILDSYRARYSSREYSAQPAHSGFRISCKRCVRPDRCLSTGSSKLGHQVDEKTLQTIWAESVVLYPNPQSIATTCEAHVLQSLTKASRIFEIVVLYHPSSTFREAFFHIP